MKKKVSVQLLLVQWQSAEKVKTKRYVARKRK